jgi:ubiquinone/menaquinone biosynthesis C-methylase UbiE
MPMSITRYVADQLRQPSGLFGKLVMSRLLNRLNGPVNELVLDSLKLMPDDRVLEVGFGGGDLLERIARTVNSGLIAGVDPSAEMVEFCRKRFSALLDSGRLTLDRGSVDQLPYPTDHFTRACTVNTIYFWPDTTQGLSELKRVLRPKGVLSIGFASAESMKRMAATRHGFTTFEPKEIEWALELAGFGEVTTARHVDWRGDYYCASGVS